MEFCESFIRIGLIGAACCSRQICRVCVCMLIFSVVLMSNVHVANCICHWNRMPFHGVIEICIIRFEWFTFYVGHSNSYLSQKHCYTLLNNGISFKFPVCAVIKWAFFSLVSSLSRVITHLSWCNSLFNTLNVVSMFPSDMISMLISLLLKWRDQFSVCLYFFLFSSYKSFCMWSI